MAFQFEKLLVYQKAVDFAGAVYATTEQFSRGYGFPVEHSFGTRHFAASRLRVNQNALDSREGAKGGRRTRIVFAVGAIRGYLGLLGGCLNG